MKKDLTNQIHCDMIQATNQKEVSNMTYGQTEKIIKSYPKRMTRFDVVLYLIGYKDEINANDIDNISELYMNGLIDT